MFYNRGEVLSDQFDHFKFCFEGGGVPALGKIPTFSRFFWETSLKLEDR